MKLTSATQQRCPTSAHLTNPIKKQGRGLATALAVVLALAAVATTSAQAQTFDVLYNFAGGSDGASPYAAPIAVKGQLYGTTMLGGTTGLCPGVNTQGCGTVFQLTPPAAPGGAWTETVIYRFQGGTNDGANPEDALVADRDGNLYGTSSAGGIQSCSGGCGTVFQLRPPSLPGGAWTETVLHRFKGVPSGNGNGDAASPDGLTIDQDGSLIGVAYGGGHCNTGETGTYCYGAVFKLTAPTSSAAPWTEQVLYRFRPPNWGYGTPTLDQAGNLYGTGGWGGFGFGWIFTLQPSATNGASWMASAVYNFQGGGGSAEDGAFPNPGLVFDQSGRLYGSTLGGGVNQPGGGTVFQLTPPAESGGDWTESVLFAFTVNGGNSPGFGPTIDSSGNLYGTTTLGGPNGLGNLFELNAEGHGTTLHSFTRTDGINPSGLLQDKNDNLYGTAQSGGTTNFGTVFRLTP
jgi:uncharacterized repeat protein (TIGR03803 family)